MMNNAAVIGRQLRQQKHYRSSYQQQNNLPRKKKKRNYFAEFREQFTIDCIVKTCKAFSIGSLVFLTGLAVMVVGFYAEPLSTHLDVAPNGTSLSRVNITQRDGLEYLTYVGPVIMGIGGITLIGAYVFAFGMREAAGAKIVPITEERLTGVDSLFFNKSIPQQDPPDEAKEASGQDSSPRKKSLTKPEISPVIILKPNRLQHLLIPDS